MPLDLRIEPLVFALCVVAGLLIARKAGRPLAWAERALSRLVRLRVPPALLAFTLTFAVCVALTALRPPLTQVHDELSYLLAADTFASGRLTNPTHPMWRHFETMHVLQNPSYQSRYPPGQALSLALGKTLTGSFIVGVWLAFSAAAAALYWAFLPWMPRKWALFASLLPALRFGALSDWDDLLYSYWTNTYWGGGVALLGAALVFGGAPRLLRRPSVGVAALFAAGLLILANSRPYEGLIASVPLGLIALSGVARNRAWSILPVAGLILACGFGWMLHYNQRVTGSPAEFPYQVYARQHDMVQTFRFQPLLPEPEYGNPQLRGYHTGFMIDGLNEQLSGLGIDSEDAHRQWSFFLGVILTPFLLLGFLWRSPWALLAGLTIITGLAAHAISAFGNLMPHYLAPAAPALLLLTVQGLRVARTFGRRAPSRYGMLAVQAAVAVVPLSFCAAVVLAGGHPSPDQLGLHKQAVTAKLQSLPGDDLVFVHYAPDHHVHAEWVYNAADIDAAPIVWARELSAESNRRLVDYFAGRKTWVLHADESPPRLEPYSPPAP